MSPPSIDECLQRLEQRKVGEMSVVELPVIPNTVSLEDLEAVRLLRQKHEQELHEYEEETRRQRHNLRKLRRTLAEQNANRENIENASDSQQNVAEDVQKAALEAEAAKTAAAALRAEQAAKAAEREAQAELAQIEREQFLSERAALEEQLIKLRSLREQAEAALESCTNDDSESDISECGPGRPPCATVVSAVVTGTVCSVNEQVVSRRGAEEPLGAVPSGAPSAASSAAPSRCSSPTGSDVAGRCPLFPIAIAASSCGVCPSLPIATVASVVEDANVGKGGAVSSTGAAVPGPTPRKGGKGKGKGPQGPPPPSGSTPRLSLPSGQVAKPSKYVNLHWKATQAPQGIDSQLFVHDPFLARLADPDESRPPLDHSALNLPPKPLVPALPQTIFTSGVSVPTFPEEMLETYFKRCEAVVKLPQVDKCKQKQDVPGQTNFLGEQKRLNMIGIMLQKHVMKHKEESNREAILNIKRAVLECDYGMVKLEGLSVIRTALRQHVKDGSPLSAYVRTHGETAIWELAYPEHHYLVHELSKVPQIDERLECMLFQLGFCENMVTCRQNLETLLKALEALKAKRDLIRRFFVTAHRLGQSLAQKQTRGFQLSTLEKLTQTKSTKMPHLSILHFLLALMTPADAQELFSTEDITLLRGAKALGTAKVCDECRELAQGLYGVKQICESGEYTNFTGQSVRIEKRRKSLPPRQAASLGEQPLEPAIDTDDCFHEVMQDFVDSQVEEADDVIEECHKMVLVYKELALFFDDLNNVYPPPRDSNDKKLDLVDVFYRFAKVVPQHRQQVEEEGLRTKIGRSGC